MKNNRSYNHLFNKDTNKNYYKISTDDRKNDKNDYRNDIIIDNNIYTYNKVKPNNKRRHRKITLDTNYYNYLKNILGNHSSNNDKSNMIGYENNHLVSSYNNTKYKFNIILDNDNKQRSQYIKINNVKLRIKSPIRQTLKEMIIKQKKKAKIFHCSTSNNKNINPKKNKYKENKEEKKDDEIKLNKNKRSYNMNQCEDSNFYTNDVNRLVINDYAQNSSKMVIYNSPKCNLEKIPKNFNKKSIFTYQKVNHENMPLNIIKINNVKYLYGLKTPNSQENRINKVCNSNKISLYDNISLAARHNSYNKNALKYKSFINNRKMLNYNQNIIQRCNKTFEKCKEFS
jgi:hypothetical protein